MKTLKFYRMRKRVLDTVSPNMSNVTHKYLFSPKSFDIIIRARYHHQFRFASNVTSLADRSKQVVSQKMTSMIMMNKRPISLALSSQLCFYVHSICHIILYTVTHCVLCEGDKTDFYSKIQALINKK